MAKTKQGFLALSAALLTLLLAGGTALAGQGRSIHLVFPVDAHFPVDWYCPFTLDERVTGFQGLVVRFDGSGHWIALIEHDQLTTTDEAFGHTVTDHFFTTRFDTGDDAVTDNGDGTLTYVARRVGHVSNTAAGRDLGLFDFTLIIDSTTFEEVSFTIARHAGQIGGTWSSLDAALAYCALFEP